MQTLFIKGFMLKNRLKEKNQTNRQEFLKKINNLDYM